jgi:hypothetical protein
MCMFTIYVHLLFRYRIPVKRGAENCSRLLEALLESLAHFAFLADEYHTIYFAERFSVLK